MDNITSLEEALCNVRKAHRLLHDYQTRMLDLAYYIKTKLGMPGFEGKKHFSDPISAQSKKNIWRDMWAWDFLYSYVYEYYLGYRSIHNIKYAVSLIQYSDTGYFDSIVGDRNEPRSFASEEDAISKLLIFIEEIKQDAVWGWGNGHSLASFILDKRYGCSGHDADCITLDNGRGKQVIYSIPLRNMSNEESVLKELQKFVDYCNKKGLIAFQGLQLTYAND